VLKLRIAGPSARPQRQWGCQLSYLGWIAPLESVTQQADGTAKAKRKITTGGEPAIGRRVKPGEKTQKPQSIQGVKVEQRNSEGRMAKSLGSRKVTH